MNELAQCALYHCAAPASVSRVRRPDLARQVAHWLRAAEGLGDLTRTASPSGVAQLEPFLARTLQTALNETVARLSAQGRVLAARLAALQTREDELLLERDLVRFRELYLRTESVLDFYGDAINTRTNGEVGAMLRACDTLAGRAMAEILEPLGITPPPVLCYLDRGLGASILKAGLTLWDGRSESSVAAIKVVRHNLKRATSLIHEAGHQVAHLLHWTDALAANLAQTLADEPALASLFAGWASEIAADAVAFVSVGHAALAALHDVLAGDAASVFRLVPSDPHPIAYLRVRLNAALCRMSFGQGPWDELEQLFMARYLLRAASSVVAEIIARSAPYLPRIAEAILLRRYAAFAGGSLASVRNPERVSPAALRALGQRAGQALFQSTHWLERESLRALALSGLWIATEPARAAQNYALSDAFMQRLGQLSLAR